MSYVEVAGLGVIAAHAMDWDPEGIQVQVAAVSAALLVAVEPSYQGDEPQDVLLLQRAARRHGRMDALLRRCATALSERTFNRRAVEPVQRAIRRLEETQEAAPHQAVEGTYNPFPWPAEKLDAPMNSLLLHVGRAHLVGPGGAGVGAHQLSPTPAPLVGRGAACRSQDGGGARARAPAGGQPVARPGP